MDPVTLILTALVAGASAITAGSLGEAGADAYNKIKDLIKKDIPNLVKGIAKKIPKDLSYEIFQTTIFTMFQKKSYTFS